MKITKTQFVNFLKEVYLKGSLKEEVADQHPAAEKTPEDITVLVKDMAAAYKEKRDADQQSQSDQSQ